MIFQEPMSSLNPCFTVGFQIGEALKTHLGLDRARSARSASSNCSRRSASPIRRGALSAFPHQLSGGMSQRVMIAMALACRPKLLIADEPTTALDVTIQAQILDLLLSLRRQNGMGLVLITHDMGVVAETADRVIVQYAGQQVESERDARAVRRSASSLYRRAARRLARARDASAGCPPFPAWCPGQHDRPRGCLFSPRCAFVFDRCRRTAPAPPRAALGRALCHTPLAARRRRSAATPREAARR